MTLRNLIQKLAQNFFSSEIIIRCNQNQHYVAIRLMINRINNGHLRST